MRINGSALPRGWIEGPLASFVIPRGEKALPSTMPGALFIGMDHIEAATTRIVGSATASEMKSAAACFRKGDVLYGRLRPYLNKVATPAFDGLASAEFIVFPDTELLRSQFLKYRLNAADFVTFASHLNEGDRPRVSFDQIGSFHLQLPPPGEQLRIIAKIEELFSELDKGLEALTTAREQLNAYRQSVLKSVFEGKLTADFHRANIAHRVTRDQLLARLRNACGVIRELDADDLQSLPTLPAQHVYTYLSNLGHLARGKSKHRPRNDPRLFGGKYPFIQTGDVRAANRIIREYSQTYNEFGVTQSHLWPKGTLCITIAANIAETAFLGFDACFPDSVVGFTALNGIVIPQYVELFIKAVRVQIEAYAPATAQKNINLTTLENLIVPLCSIEEQKLLVDCVEQLFSIADATEADIQNHLVRCEALRQSILRRAFSGQLVAQNPEDEPATALLERIHAERAKQTTKKERITKNGTKKAA